jgi:enoyl-CoA hydratase/carnithine racemase
MSDPEDTLDTPEPPDRSNDDLRVEVSDDGLVCRATIDRPDQRNALNDAVLSGLGGVLEYADGSDVLVVVIRGAGGSFCSGGDMKSMASAFGQGAQAYREGFSGLADVMTRAKETSALVVAAVEGYCLAGGMGLAASCDVVFASDEATFGLPEVDIGLFPAQALVPIMRTVPEKQGMRLLFTGEKIGAGEAHEMGFTTKVAPADEFDGELDAFVDSLASSSPVMIEMGKESYYTQRDMGFDEALSYMREVIALIAMSEDTEEGINAFLTGSEPKWKGR